MVENCAADGYPMVASKEVFCGRSGVAVLCPHCNKFCFAGSGRTGVIGTRSVWTARSDKVSMSRACGAQMPAAERPVDARSTGE